jgi:hypothetical protein
MKRCSTAVLILWLTLTLIANPHGNDAFAAANSSVLDSLTIQSPPDSFNIRKKSFLLPQATAPWKYSSSIFLYDIFVPPDWTLDVIKVPMFCYAGKYTLPHNFNIQASLATLLISYRFCVGPVWNYSVGKTHFGLGYQLVYNYGILTEFGYSTRITGFEHQPMILAGYSFNQKAITFKGEVYLTRHLTTYQGDHQFETAGEFTNGYSGTLALEQRLTKNHVLSIAFKWAYIRYHMVAWPAFPVNQYYYNVPEVQVGYNF